ncbi:hypothetical protein [Actinomadura sp. 21ATH]|uniref:hypothetical protein n=1 Tax=Actinomadura sp. 21ATH TaxID=1735444 RepID=UPI0035C18B55
MSAAGVERVLSPGGACWICGLPAVCGEKLPGRKRKVRGLCQTHADAIFGAEDPAWRRLDDKTQREIVDDWLRAMTILANGGHRPLEELMAEIAAVNDTRTEHIKIITPLMPGEAYDLDQADRAQRRLRSRETMVHAMITQILLGWCATASGETRGDVLQRLALTLDTWLDQPEPPAQGPSAGSS